MSTAENIGRSIGTTVRMLLSLLKKATRSSIVSPSGVRPIVTGTIEYKQWRAVAIGMLVFGAVAAQLISWLGSPGIADVQYGCTAVGALLVLFWAALAAHQADPRQLDLLVAAETLVSLGIGSLVFGLGMGIIRFVYSPPIFTSETAMEALGPYLYPFAEGLIAAALAPVFAVYLRNIESDDRYTRSGSGLTGTADDIPLLAAEFDRFTTKIKVVTDSLDGLAETFKRSGNEWHATAKSVTDSMAEFSQTIGDQSKGIGGEIEKLRFTLSGGRDGIAAAMDHIAGSGERFEKATKSAGEAMHSLADQTETFKQKLREGSRLLDGLRDLIASVDRFVKPDAKP